MGTGKLYRKIIELYREIEYRSEIIPLTYDVDGCSKVELSLLFLAVMAELWAASSAFCLASRESAMVFRRLTRLRRLLLFTYSN